MWTERQKCYYLCRDILTVYLSKTRNTQLLDQKPYVEKEQGKKGWLSRGKRKRMWKVLMCEWDLLQYPGECPSVLGRMPVVKSMKERPSRAGILWAPGHWGVVFYCDIGNFSFPEKRYLKDSSRVFLIATGKLVSLWSSTLGFLVTGNMSNWNLAHLFEVAVSDKKTLLLPLFESKKKLKESYLKEARNCD